MYKTINVIAILLGVVCLFLAAIYWMMPASALPAYLPGYDPALNAVHFKHGLAALILGLALFVFVWFRTGKKKIAQTSDASGKQQ